MRIGGILSGILSEPELSAFTVCGPETGCVDGRLKLPTFGLDGPATARETDTPVDKMSIVLSADPATGCDLEIFFSEVLDVVVESACCAGLSALPVFLGLDGALRVFPAMLQPAWSFSISLSEDGEGDVDSAGSGTSFTPADAFAVAGSGI